MGRRAPDGPAPAPASSLRPRRSRRHWLRTEAVDAPGLGGAPELRGPGIVLPATEVADLLGAGVARLRRAQLRFGPPALSYVDGRMDGAHDVAVAVRQRHRGDEEVAPERVAAHFGVVHTAVEEQISERTFRRDAPLCMSFAQLQPTRSAGSRPRAFASTSLTATTRRLRSSTKIELRAVRRSHAPRTLASLRSSASLQHRRTHTRCRP